MAVLSRGFGLRRRESDERLPPGQFLTEPFPVLSAGSPYGERRRPNPFSWSLADPGSFPWWP